MLSKAIHGEQTVTEYVADFQARIKTRWDSTQQARYATIATDADSIRRVEIRQLIKH